jgi:uncharacterized protein (UPF0332 family)
MPYHEDLIEHALFLATLNPGQPKQADLRRAVSAAYYALFHLLTAEAAENWKHQHQRHRFARLFNHGRIKQVASNLSLPKTQDAVQANIGANLKTVAESFVMLQQQRHTADYDNGRAWSPTQAHDAILLAQDSIKSWMIIRDEDVAQEFLLDLIVSR